MEQMRLNRILGLFLPIQWVSGVNVIIIFVLIYTIPATWFFWTCMKRVVNKWRVFLTLLFSLAYGALFSFIQLRVPSSIKYWHTIDGIMVAMAEVGCLVILYQVYRKIRQVLGRS